MELYRELLIHALMRGEIQISISNEEVEISKIVEGKCYRALQKIKAIIDDDSLEDEECFQKIAEIICVLEDIGTNGGNRHDFGRKLSRGEATTGLNLSICP